MSKAKQLLENYDSIILEANLREIATIVGNNPTLLNSIQKSIASINSDPDDKKRKIKVYSEYRKWEEDANKFFYSIVDDEQSRNREERQRGNVTAYSEEEGKSGFASRKRGEWISKQARGWLVDKFSYMGTFTDFANAHKRIDNLASCHYAPFNDKILPHVEFWRGLGNSFEFMRHSYLVMMRKDQLEEMLKHYKYDVYYHASKVDGAYMIGYVVAQRDNFVPTIQDFWSPLDGYVARDRGRTKTSRTTEDELEDRMDRIKLQHARNEPRASNYLAREIYGFEGTDEELTIANATITKIFDNYSKFRSEADKIKMLVYGEFSEIIKNDPDINKNIIKSYGELGEEVIKIVQDFVNKSLIDKGQGVNVIKYVRDKIIKTLNLIDTTKSEPRITHSSAEQLIDDLELSTLLTSSEECESIKDVLTDLMSDSKNFLRIYERKPLNPSESVKYLNRYFPYVLQKTLPNLIGKIIAEYNRNNSTNYKVLNVI